MVFNRSIRHLACAPDEAALFGAFFAHEEYASSLGAVRARIFLLSIPGAWEIRAVGNGEADGPVGFDDVNAAGSDNAKGWDW